MTRTRKAPEPPLPQFTTKKGNDTAVLVGVDGRSQMARRFREIVTGIQSDLGGDLTTAQSHLIARAATLAIWAEQRESELAEGKEFDAAAYCTVANAQRRLLADLGLERRARNVTPSLTEYLSARAA